MAEQEEYYGQKRVVNLNNGDVYEGTFMGKAKHGYGIYRFANGDVYQGEW